MHVYLLAQALEERGHSVVVFTSARARRENIFDEKAEVLRYEGIFQRIPFLFRDAALRHNPPIQDPLIMRELERVIRQSRPDIVHSHGWILYSAVFAARKYSVPIIHTLHNFSLICPNKVLANKRGICSLPFSNRCIPCCKTIYGNWAGISKSALAYLGVKLNRCLAKKVNKFIAVSSFVKELYLEHLQLNPDSIVVVPNFIEAPDSRRRRYGATGKSVRKEKLPDDFFLFVGALSPRKGVEILIDAYKQLRTTTKLVFVGNTEPGHDYSSLENVLFFKNMPRAFVEEALSKCKFLVVPSILPETFSIVAWKRCHTGKR